MTDISNATDLLETARDALLRDVLPALPAEHRYAALMIANAIGIAAREHALGNAAASAEAAGLGALLGGAGRLPAALDADEPARALPALRSAARAAIRSGAFDAPDRARELAAVLARTAHDGVAISNPKALQPVHPGEARAPSSASSS